MTRLKEKGMMLKWSCLVHYMIMMVTPAFIFMLYGCTVEPSKELVKDTVVKHFESRNYRVVDIKIGNVESLPLGRRDYMAPTKYAVNVPLIILESKRGSTYKKKEPFTFRNALITIRSTGRHGEWMIDTIAGIPVT
jgi:hypothetical protein